MLPNPPKPEGRYNEPPKFGLPMADTHIDRVVDLIGLGSDQALEYLEIDSLPFAWPTFHFSIADQPFGYWPIFRRLVAPIPYLNYMSGLLQANSWDGLQIRPEMPGGSPTSLEAHLIDVGREETVHMAQHLTLSAELLVRCDPEHMEWLVSASELERNLCAVEVEAREVVDAVRIRYGAAPRWRPFDAHLRRAHPLQYGRTRPNVVQPEVSTRSVSNPGLT